MEKITHNLDVDVAPDNEILLIDGLRIGDISSYEILYKRYYSNFHAFIRMMTKDDFLAYDITQNIFMKVWMNRERLDSNKSIKNYLYVLAKHEVLNHFRAMSRHRITALSEVDNFENIFTSFQSINNIEEKMDLEYTQKKIDIIINKMPTQRQLIFKLSRFDNRSNKEIAELLKLSVRTVDKHIELALKELKKNVAMVPLIILFLDIFPKQ